MSIIGESPVKQVWYHNPCNGINDGGSSMLEVHPNKKNKNKRGLEFEVPPDRSNKKHCRNNSSVSKWTSLPNNIFDLILDKLLEPVDHVRLAVVCKHWQSVSKEYNHATQRWCKVLPMLMVPFCSRTKRMVYSVSEGKLYTNVQLQVLYDRRCSGSSHGWLATTDENFAITLMNPFRKVLPIILPRLVIPTNYESHPKGSKQQYEYYVEKVILSADPHLNPDNYVVVAIYDLLYRQLAFIKAGQKSWTYIKETQGFFDVNFYNSQIYAVQKGGEIVSLDVSTSNDPSQPPTVNELTPPLPLYPFPFPDMGYLVKSTSGDLLHVQRFARSEKEEGIMCNESFVVYKLVFNENDGSVVKQLELESIGDDALFLGDNHSISISASSFHKCKPNSIYYTNDTIHPIPRGMGIFSLATRSISQHYPLNPRARYIPRAIWIEPQFKGLCSHESHHHS